MHRWQLREAKTNQARFRQDQAGHRKNYRSPLLDSQPATLALHHRLDLVTRHVPDFAAGARILIRGRRESTAGRGQRLGNRHHLFFRRRASSRYVTSPAVQMSTLDSMSRPSPCQLPNSWSVCGPASHRRAAVDEQRCHVLRHQFHGKLAHADLGQRQRRARLVAPHQRDRRQIDVAVDVDLVRPAQRAGHKGSGKSAIRCASANPTASPNSNRASEWPTVPALLAVGGGAMRPTGSSVARSVGVGALPSMKTSIAPMRAKNDNRAARLRHGNQAGNNE